MILFKKNALRAPLKAVHCLFVLCFLSNLILPAPSFGQVLLGLPQPQTLLSVTPPYTPVLLSGIEIHPENPLLFDFIINNGDDNLEDKALKAEAEKMIKYFFASLTVPDKDLWVNLSPYEKDKIIPDELAKTDLGRDFLTQDYLLKQLMASLIYPEKELGKKFWDRVYQKAFEAYGTTQIPVDTFNKVWIMPQNAVVYEHGQMVFVAEASLKVMLEEDYVALQKSAESRALDARGVASQEAQSSSLIADSKTQEPGSKSQELASDIIRDIVIPELEKEVNEGKTFAALRQMYQALILGAWFKRSLKESLLGKIYVDQNKVIGLDLEEDGIKEKVYQRYLEAYKQGAYNFIKPEYDENTKRHIPRKYFSGGFRPGQDIHVMIITSTTPTHREKMTNTKGKKRKGSQKVQVVLHRPPLKRSTSPWVEQNWFFINENKSEQWSPGEVAAYLKEKYVDGTQDSEKAQIVISEPQATKSALEITIGSKRYVAIAPHGLYKERENRSSRWIVYYYEEKKGVSSSIKVGDIVEGDGLAAMNHIANFYAYGLGNEIREIVVHYPDDEQMTYSLGVFDFEGIWDEVESNEDIVSVVLYADGRMGRKSNSVTIVPNKTYSKWKITEISGPSQGSANRLSTKPAQSSASAIIVHGDVNLENLSIGENVIIYSDYVGVYDFAQQPHVPFYLGRDGKYRLNNIVVYIDKNGTISKKDYDLKVAQRQEKIINALRALREGNFAKQRLALSWLDGKLDAPMAKDYEGEDAIKILTPIFGEPITLKQLYQEAQILFPGGYAQALQQAEDRVVSSSSLPVRALIQSHQDFLVSIGQPLGKPGSRINASQWPNFLDRIPGKQYTVRPSFLGFIKQNSIWQQYVEKLSKDKDLLEEFSNEKIVQSKDIILIEPNSTSYYRITENNFFILMSELLAQDPFLARAFVRELAKTPSAGISSHEVVQAAKKQISRVNDPVATLVKINQLNDITVTLSESFSDMIEKNSVLSEMLTQAAAFDWKDDGVVEGFVKLNFVESPGKKPFQTMKIPFSSFIVLASELVSFDQGRFFLRSVIHAAQAQQAQAGSALTEETEYPFEQMRSMTEETSVSSTITLKVPEGTTFPISILEGKAAQDLYDRLARKPIVVDYEMAQLPEDLGKKLVGGKSYQLALMWAKDPDNNFRITSVTSTFAEEFIKSDPVLLKFIHDQIQRLNSSNGKERDQVTQEIRERIKKTPVPPAIQKAIVQTFHELGDVPLAVRSSGRAEDIKLEEIPELSGTSIGASAGQHDSYLGVDTPEETVERWRDNVASLYTDRATDYRDGMMVYAAFGALFKAKTVQNIVDTLKEKTDADSQIVAKALEERNIKIISSLTLYNTLQTNGFSREAELVQGARDRFAKIENISMGVTLMPMADAQVSFVLFGADLSSGWTAKDFTKINSDQHFNEGRVFVITTNYKLGESIVQGIAMPDTYLVHVIREGQELKVNILSRQLGTKKIQAVYKQPLMTLLGLKEENLNDFIELIKTSGESAARLAEKFDIPVDVVETLYRVLQVLTDSDIDKTAEVEVYEQEQETVQRAFGYDRQGLNKLAHLIKEVSKDSKTKTVFTDVEEERQNVFAATDSQIVEIAKEGMRKAEGYENIVDMEGVIGHNFGKPNRVVTVQRRPSNAEVDVSKPNLIEINYTYVSPKDIRTAQATHQHMKDHQETGVELGESLVNGFATRNAFSGQLYVIDSTRDLNEQFTEIKEIAKSKKVIIRTRETTPDYIPILKHENVVGVVADMGGPTSHAAVVSRELGIATVVGIEAWLSKLVQSVGPRKAEQIRKYLNTAGNIVTVDANANEDTGYGTIYAGELPVSRRDIKIDVSRLPKIFTKIGYIMGMPHPMLAMSKMGQYDGFSGVALMRGEFPYGEENIHPRAGVAYDHYLVHAYLVMKGDHEKARQFYDQLRESERLALKRFISELNRRAAMRKAGVEIPLAEVERAIKENLSEFGHADAEAFLKGLSELARVDFGLLQEWFDQTDGKEDVIGQMSEQIKGYLSYHDFFSSVHGGAVGLMAAANSREKNTVVYRSIDFKKNEARSLIGARMFDPQPEPATMIGERGARWLLKPENQIILRNEIKMLLEQVDRGYTNLGFMFPFVATPQELDQLMTILQEEEKKISQELGRPVYLREVGQMIELPSNVIQAEDFADILIKHQKEAESWFKAQFGLEIKRKSFFSFGTNDLTQTTKGADRDNPEMKYLMNEAHPFVVESIRHVANVAKKYGIKCGLCGQALVNLVDKNPEAAEEILMILGATDGYAGTDYLGTEKAITLSARGTLKHGKVADITGKETLIESFSSNLKRGAAARAFFTVSQAEDLGQSYIGDFVLIDNENIDLDLQDDKVKAQLARLGAVLCSENLPLATIEFIEKLRVPVIRITAEQQASIKSLKAEKMLTIDFSSQSIFGGELTVDVQVPTVESKIKIVKSSSQPKEIPVGQRIKVADFYQWLGIHPLAFLKYDNLEERKSLPQDVRDEIALRIRETNSKSATDAYKKILRKFIVDQAQGQGVGKGQTIVFETSDMESDDFAKLRGGSHFVHEKEINPPLGVAGLDALTRVDDFRQLFAIELGVIKWLIDMGYDAAVQFNSVKIPDHLVKALKIMKDIGLDTDAMKLGMNTAWPGNYLFMESFIEAGKLSFVTIDMKRLGQGYWAADIASGKNQNVVDSYKSPEVWKNLDTPVNMIKNALIQKDVALAGEVVSSTLISNTDTDVPATPSPTGGIDFASLYQDLNIKTNGQGLPLAIEFQDFEAIECNGFIPVIIQMTPINNLPQLLGFKDTGEDAPEVARAQDHLLSLESRRMEMEKPKALSQLN